MNPTHGHLPDTLLLGIAIALVVVGLFVFMSASFGLLARAGASWTDVLFSQIVLGLCGGLLLSFGAYSIPLKFLRRFAFHIFIFAIILCTLVFVPHIGLSAGGAARWIDVMGFSFQPSEFLKLAFILFLSSWATGIGDSIKSARYGLLPFLSFLTPVTVLLFLQPDTGTFLVIFVTALAIFLVAGGRFKHLFMLLAGAVLAIGLLAIFRPYVRDRIETFIRPSSNPLGSSYQIRQSLLAIGSGQFSGRGFGQSVQKFQYLPEPTGDSIFAVLGEEFGFIGTTLITLLFLSLCLRSLSLIGRTQSKFHRLLGTGLVIMITSQAYLHIGAMVGVLPLSGLPLPFVSHGGTALMFSLIAVGLLLQISTYAHKK